MGIDRGRDRRVCVPCPPRRIGQGRPSREGMADCRMPEPVRRDVGQASPHSRPSEPAAQIVGAQRRTQSFGGCRISGKYAAIARDQLLGGCHVAGQTDEFPLHRLLAVLFPHEQPHQHRPDVYHALRTWRLWLADPNARASAGLRPIDFLRGASDVKLATLYVQIVPAKPVCFARAKTPGSHDRNPKPQVRVAAAIQ